MPGWLVSNTMWHDIFALGAPVVEKTLRPVAVYFFLVIALLLDAPAHKSLVNFNMAREWAAD